MTLVVTERDNMKSLETLRASGNIPAIVYGPAQSPITISLDGKVFEKILKEAGESTVLQLAGLKSPVDVLIKEVDFNPVKQRVNHVDFYAIAKGREITTHVSLHFINEAPIEESRIGSVTKVMHELEVTCKPTDLPSHIDVDLSVLTSVADKILVSDLMLSKVVKVSEAPETPIVVVSEVVQAVNSSDETASINMNEIEVEKKGTSEETK